jgi:hypothetical protein
VSADARPLSREPLSIGPEAIVQSAPDTDAPSNTARPRTVAVAITLLEQARQMSEKNPPQDQRALAILDDVYRYLNGFLYGDAIQRSFRGHSAMNSMYAEIIIGEAVGGVHSIASFIRLGAHPSKGTWDFNLNKVGVARQYLEVVASNVSANESNIVAAVDTATDWGLEIARAAVEFTPVIGSLVMLGEALVGKSILGKDLTTGERALLGFGALLAEVGTLIRVGKTVAAASRIAEVADISTAKALRLCWASRGLTDAERGLLAQYAAKVRAGTKLAAEETVLVNRLLGKLSEAERALAVREAVQAATGEASKAGRFTDLAARTSASEKAIGQALAAELSADVVRVAEDAAVAGAKNPDFLINNVVAELVELETTAAAKSPITSALTKIIDKHRQAGIVIVDLTNSVVTGTELLGSSERLWNNPRFLDVAKLIVTRAGHVIGVLERPASLAGPLTSLGVKAGVKAGEAAQQR